MASNARRFATAASLLLLAGCYLPGAQTSERPLAEQVRVVVTGCGADRVAGTIRNDADVSVRATLRSKWLDAASDVYHQEELEIASLAPGAITEWETTTTGELESPLLCQAEAATVEALE